MNTKQTLMLWGIGILTVIVFLANGYTILNESTETLGVKMNYIIGKMLPWEIPILIIGFLLIYTFKNKK